MKSKQKKIINYGKQHIFQTNFLKLKNSLKSNFLTTGLLVNNFENKIKKYTKSNYVTVCSSGTSALHCALNAINLKKNDVVIMPVINFIAAYSMCSLLKAKIYLADTNTEGEMKPNNVYDCIKKNKIKKIKLIINMDLGGKPNCPIEFYQLKKKFKCFLILDGCHSFGANYLHKNKRYKVGCSKHADITTFSFHPVKTITTGEGGAIVTNNLMLHKKINIFRSHGIVRNRKEYWNYDIPELGFNYRISDINCSLGIDQLKYINLILRKRKKIALKYFELFKPLKKFFLLPEKKNSNLSSWHLFILRIKLENFKKNCTKDDLIKFMIKNNIYLQFHYKPINKFSFYKQKKLKFENSDIYYKTEITIPIYYSMTLNEQKKILNGLIKFTQINKK